MHTIYLIINGSLNMSPGDCRTEFPACQRLMQAADTPEQQKALMAWQERGTKTIVKIATTEHLFERACNELEGAVMIDEGMNEVAPDSKTIFASFPIAQDMPTPQILKHKRIPIYRGDREMATV